MTRSRRLLIIAVAAVLSVAITFSVIKHMNQTAAESSAAPETELVQVAATDLPPGTVIETAHLKSVVWPRADMPAGAIRDGAALAGRVVVRHTLPGEPITESRLAPKGSQGGLAVTIPAGYRAVSVRVDEVMAVSGFASPSSRVDVIATVGGRSDGGITHVVLEDVRVLATDTRTEAAKSAEVEKYTVATLLVTPAEAEKLVFVANQGRLQLALRNPLDADRVTTSGATLKSILPAAPAVVRAEAKEKSAGVPVELISGPVRTTTRHRP